jgi:hypothetical protein
VALSSAISFFRDVFEYEDLTPLDLIDNFPFDRGTGYIRVANFNGPIVNIEKDLFPLNVISNLEWKTINLNGLPFSSHILFST